MPAPSGNGRPKGVAAGPGAASIADSIAWMAERDYLTAISEHVVVYDGGMGATLEQFELTSEDYGGLEGKCHEALVLNRPDVIEGVHASMLDAGAEVVETDTFQGSRIKLGEWGLADYTVEINTKAAESRAKRRASTATSPARSAHRLSASVRGPLARADPLRRAGGGLHRAGRGPDRRRR